MNRRRVLLGIRDHLLLACVSVSKKCYNIVRAFLLRLFIRYLFFDHKPCTVKKVAENVFSRVHSQIVPTHTLLDWPYDQADNVVEHMTTAGLDGSTT